MIVRDNHGRIVSEINQVRDAEGTSITTNTMYYNEHPVAQTITVRDSQGKVETRNILGGKILP